MSEPFIGEIRIFGGNFNPTSWALCNGQLLSIAQNSALFSLLGTTYGGDGRVTFGLPNLQGSAPMHWGSGPGLTPRAIGETAGSPTVTLIPTDIPTHTHALTGSSNVSTDGTPANQVYAGTSTATLAYLPPASLTAMAPGAITPSGGNQPHNNMQPYLGLTFIIAISGVFPSRS